MSGSDKISAAQRMEIWCAIFTEKSKRNNSKTASKKAGIIHN